MGRAIETVAGQLTAAGGTVVNMPAVSGDSFTIRNSSKRARLLTVWSQSQGVGGLRLTSPLLHDTTNGISLQHGSVPGVLVNPMEAQQMLEPQDQISVGYSGSATAGDIEQGIFTVYYEDLPGIDGKFLSPAELSRRLANVFSYRISMNMGATGGYSGSEALTAETDTFKANTEYAVLGVSGSVPSAMGSVGFRSPDWGNLRIGVPMVSRQDLYNNYFVDLSRQTGLSCIPVFNSANRAQTFIDGIGSENSGAVGLSILLAELSRVR